MICEFCDHELIRDGCRIRHKSTHGFVCSVQMGDFICGCDMPIIKKEMSD